MRLLVDVEHPPSISQWSEISGSNLLHWNKRSVCYSHAGNERITEAKQSVPARCSSKLMARMKLCVLGQHAFCAICKRCGGPTHCCGHMTPSQQRPHRRWVAINRRWKRSTIGYGPKGAESAKGLALMYAMRGGELRADWELYSWPWSWDWTIYTRVCLWKYYIVLTVNEVVSMRTMVTTYITRDHANRKGQCQAYVLRDNYAWTDLCEVDN